MRSQHLQLKFLIATVAVLLAMLVGAMSAGAADDFIPGVTDSTTGVMAELDKRYIPGVTDSTTGVLRELERRREEGHHVASDTSTGQSGFGDDAAVALGAALAALLTFALLALLAAARRRRVAI
jgi:hypothetical protein